MEGEPETLPLPVVRPPDQKPFPFRLEFPEELPISARAEEIVSTLQRHQVLVLAGETGSGKTTQMPKLCLAAGRGVLGRIACTQPRRVAALSVSRRVAEELGVAWGREVGCKVRFDDRTSRATVIKFLTDGMLLAEVQGDPLLREYDTIILDEAHERSLNIDFLLGHLRNLRFRRPELKIIITSATIDTAMFSRAFDDAPVIEVSGRTYPVEVVYAPLDALGRDYADDDENEDRSDPAAVSSARAEALHYIDGAVEAVERIVRDGEAGDVLVFMPSERDIRETAELLAARRWPRCELVPLYGRLTNAEQQRVFAPTPGRKIIVATNIAETSLTLPGIRFVVDTGLARVSRYAPASRTRRLPIEPVSQASADQRKGRSGRVADGVCIRLYREEDFLARPRFTQPEIQRANLADVILRLKAYGLGDIERFPFINMPAAKSVRAGYALLEELGALATEETVAGGTRELTAIGRELARLPVDPTVGRMILQARREKALREVLVIAAGLSIQDPRERPLDKQAAADAAHRRFAHPDSDFLTLLNIWEAYHDEFETMTQNKLRRFCREHFLSYPRMREWRDIHAQLAEVTAGRDRSAPTSAWDGLPEADPRAATYGTPAYRAIHRSILAGLLGTIACLDDASGDYRAAHDRRVSLFPGSTLHRKAAAKAPRAEAGARPPRAKEVKGARWIMAAEITETSRLFARTAAKLDPAWALDLGRHLTRVTHRDPWWDAEKGRVLVKKTTRLYGLELENRAVSYGRVNARHATEIFLREGLVADTVAWPFTFLSHNRAVRAEVESVLTRTRDRGYHNLDEALYRFYAARLSEVSAVGELVDLVRERQTSEPRFLEITAADMREEGATVDPAAYPAILPLENRVLPLHYAYQPGQDQDGVTLEVKVAEAETLTAAALDWAVPGHLLAKVEHHLRAMPKEVRRHFVPLAETTRQLAEAAAARDRLTGRRETLTEALAVLVRERFGLTLPPEQWAAKPLPDYLRVRVRVVDDDGRELGASRDLAEVRLALDVHRRAASVAVARQEPTAWREARRKWETGELGEWGWGDIPRVVPVTTQAGVPVVAYPGLVAGEEGVGLRLFRDEAEACDATRAGVTALLQQNLRYDLGWLERDLRALRELGPLAATLAPSSTLQAQALAGIRTWVSAPSRCPSEEAPSSHLVTAAAWAQALARAKADLRGLVPRLMDGLREALELRQSLLVHATPYAGLADDVQTVMPADFLTRWPYEQWGHLPRYLRARVLRAGRWKQNPPKDAERASEVARWVKAARALPPGDATQEMWGLIEEYRVSLFAQELGTVIPVSAKKLAQVLAAARGEPATSPLPAPPPPPSRPLLPAANAAARAKQPLKSLQSLDVVFKR
jgi:ATP-dependent helicase HrpA